MRLRKLLLCIQVSVLLICAALAKDSDVDDDIRLPSNIVPKNYRVKLLPILREDDFRLYGSVRMEFLVKEATDRIVMHAVNLTISDNINIVPVLVKNKNPQSRSFDADLAELLTDPVEQANGYNISYDTRKDFVFIDLPWTLIANRRYRISMNYRGKVSDTLTGLYRTHYIDRNTSLKRWIAVTQMEPTAARQVFPCLDEPAMKATFEMIIGRSENMSSISNMPLARSLPMRNKDGWFWDYFEKSVPMSTYLVACVISDFEFRAARRLVRQIDSPEVNGTTSMRVGSQWNLIGQSDHALQVAPAMLEYLENYFQIPFPLPKIDLVAVPDFAAGAMENWGLITFSETSLLVDLKASSARDKMDIELVIAHELAHQWFGNLVTMKWWNDLWLNEGFATYMERVVMDNVSPLYEYGTLQSLEILNVLETDALDSTHPVSAEVAHPDEIEEIFDDVSYNKGCAIIRMMNHYLGENTFRASLTKYLNETKYRNAEQDDLWRFMTQQAHADGVLPTDIDVKSIMDTWTLQMGFPLITITRDYATGWVTFQQKHFRRTTGNYVSVNARLVDEDKESDSNYLWWVPISYTDSIEQNFSDNNTMPRVWLSPDQTTESHHVDMPQDSWLLANVQATGYFRVNYDERNWHLLTDQLLSDHHSIHVLNRAHLISDAFALAANNLLPYSTPFALIMYLKNEDHFVPWQSALNELNHVGRMFLFTPHFGRYKAFMSSLIIPSYLRMQGIKEGESITSRFARTSLTRQACANGYRPCVREAQRLFDDWMNSFEPLNFTGIRPESRETVYCTAIKYGGVREWDFAWQMALNVPSSQQREKLIASMGCSREPWILIRYLSLILKTDSGIRKQDKDSVIASVSANPVGRSIAFRFIRDNFDHLIATNTIQVVMTMLDDVTESFNTVDDFHTVAEFFVTKLEVMKTVQDSYKSILTNIAANVDWMDRNSAALIQWFELNGY